MKRVTRIALGVLLLAVIAAGCFYGGTVYGKGQAQTAVSGPGGAGAPPGLPQNGTPPAGQANGSQGGMLSGQIQAVDSGGFTVTDQSGKQVQVKVTDSTLIQKQASVTVAELQQGETVMVSGSQAADGSITARSVQVMPAGGLGQPGSNQTGGGQSGGNAAGGTNP